MEVVAMQEATAERLSKIISDPPPGEGRSGGNRRLPRKSGLHLHFGLAEGWFSLVLLAIVVYSTIWCVQAAGWVDHLNILSLTTLLGLIGGVLAAKQRRIPRLLVHTIAVVVGILLAFWQTAGADYGGNVAALANSMHQWVVLALAGGTSSDDSIFLFFILALGFLLAYTSAWLVYRTRSPWLMILANAVVLLINLNYIDAGYIVFLVVFLVAALLLLLRFNLYESSTRWKKLGLRSSDDLGWEFMQAGALISIGILIFAWLLPWGYENDTAAQIWSADNNPWVQIQNAWDRLVSVNGGSTASNHGNFTDTVVLGGNPHLNGDTVFTVKTDDGSGQYLESNSFDMYNGRGWSVSPTVGSTLNANTVSYDGSADLRIVRQNVTVVNPPGEQHAYIFGAPQIASADQAATVILSKADGAPIAWERKLGKLAAGNSYSVVSYVSAADIKTLESIPMPADAPSFTPDPAHPDLPTPVTYYNPQILQMYLQVPNNLNPAIKGLAEHVTAGATTMYDKVVALETYLRSNYAYDVNISPPPGVEGVSWFLFSSGNRGFCNYYATAMAIMARELGIPARVVTGYTSGKFDPKQHQWVIHGFDAHMWTQVYFAGYGWINFEPSQSFSSFTRPTASPSGSTSGIGGVPPGGSQTGKTTGHRQSLADQSSGGQGDVTTTPAQQAAQLRQDVGLAVLGLLLLILAGVVYFGIWWRRLFRGYGIPAQIYGRICVLANLAGISIRRSQTPYEYIHTLAQEAPEQAVTLERLGDIYVRDRWADPSGAEHPRRTGEIAELPGMWKRLQPQLFLHVLRHPHFLRWLPDQLIRFIRERWSRRHTRELSEVDVEIQEEP
jgi:Transglutaminase-like superfamily/TgpA N-terminal domain